MDFHLSTARVFVVGCYLDLLWYCEVWVVFINQPMLCAIRRKFCSKAHFFGDDRCRKERKRDAPLAWGVFITVDLTPGKLARKMRFFA